MSEHVRWEPRRGRDSEAVRAGYEAAKRAYELGQAVRARRLELGMSQTELAERAGMTQSAVSRLEAGGTVPTIGVLERLAAALSAELVRITYWLAPGRRVMLFTIFYKTQRSETAEVQRAFIAQKGCEASHRHAENVYNREISNE
jgi:HTH-type transcriptional regulator/antitoxin HipB